MTISSALFKKVLLYLDEKMSVVIPLTPDSFKEVCFPESPTAVLSLLRDAGLIELDGAGNVSCLTQKGEMLIGIAKNPLEWMAFEDAFDKETGSSFQGRLDAGGAVVSRLVWRGDEPMPSIAKELVSPRLRRAASRLNADGPTYTPGLEVDPPRGLERD